MTIIDFSMHYKPHNKELCWHLCLTALYFCTARQESAVNFDYVPPRDLAIVFKRVEICTLSLRKKVSVKISIDSAKVINSMWKVKVQGKRLHTWL